MTLPSDSDYRYRYAFALPLGIGGLAILPFELVRYAWDRLFGHAPAWVPPTFHFSAPEPIAPGSGPDAASPPTPPRAGGCNSLAFPVPESIHTSPAAQFEDATGVEPDPELAERVAEYERTHEWMLRDRW